MIEAFDYGILEFFQRIQNPVLTSFLKFFTVIGEAGCVWILCGIVLFCLREHRKYGLILLFSLLLCLIFGNVFLKNAVARPRPCWRYPQVQMLISVPKDFSFPSGHTFASFAAAFSLFHWKKLIGAAAFVVALVIAASRLYFFVHYPTDIIAGALFGSALAFISIFCVETLAKRKSLIKRKQ